MFYSILPSVHHVEALSKLPETIRSSLQKSVNLQDIESKTDEINQEKKKGKKFNYEKIVKTG